MRLIRMISLHPLARANDFANELANSRHAEDHATDAVAMTTNDSHPIRSLAGTCTSCIYDELSTVDSYMHSTLCPTTKPQHRPQIR